MNDSIIHLVKDYGYLFFFLAFCLGPFGIPIPNEITILTSGALSSSGMMTPWRLYASILAGLLTAITAAFFIGKIVGQSLIIRHQHSRHFKRAEALIMRYGNRAMCIGLFIPVIRYILPILIGIGKIPFRKFALISYFTAMMWTATYFTFGIFLGERTF